LTYLENIGTLSGRTETDETERWAQVIRSVDHAASSELMQTPITQVLAPLVDP
jgi:hypothetical protein